MIVTPIQNRFRVDFSFDIGVYLRYIEKKSRWYIITTSVFIWYLLRKNLSMLFCFIEEESFQAAFIFETIFQVLLGGVYIGLGRKRISFIKEVYVYAFQNRCRMSFRHD